VVVVVDVIQLQGPPVVVVVDSWLIQNDHHHLLLGLKCMMDGWMDGEVVSK